MPFQKGESGNPGGRPKTPEEIKLIRSYTKNDIALAYYKFAQMKISEAEEYEPENLLEAGILKCFSDFIGTGKTDQIRHIWAEVHGKPRETVDLGISGGMKIVYLDKQDADL